MPVRANMLIPYFESANRLTGHCTAPVRGKRFVMISATVPGGMRGSENIRVAEATAASTAVVGVSVFNGALDEEIPLINSNLLVPMTAGAAITAGQPITSDAEGRAVPATAGQPVFGVAVESQATVNNDVGVKLRNL